MKKEESTLKHKIVTMLERKEVEFLDKLKNDALFSTGHNLSYNDILKGLVDMAMESHLDAQNVHDVKDLEERMYAKIRETLVKLKNK
jgi:hypothetical protein